MMFLVQGSHGSTCWRNDIVNEEEESIFRSEVDPLADQKVELANSQIRWN
jgi:hypothetical protein